MTTRASPAEAEIRIDCGSLRATFSKGDLFDVRWNGVEVVQRLYVAVRDEAWNTIPAQYSDVEARHSDDGVRITFTAHHVYGDIDFLWRGDLRVSANGIIEYGMHGTTQRSFRYCKIGFNVHHGSATHAGRAFRCRTAAGIYDGEFAAAIDPQLVQAGTLTAMTPDFDALEIDLPGVDVAMEFSGDRFEMQDHRNWADANWKTYGTPLAVGFPMDINRGAELSQSIVVRMSGPGLGAARGDDAAIDVRIDSTGDDRLPAIGHLFTTTLDPQARAAVPRLRPAHLRVDLHPADDLAAVLADAAATARQAGAGLEVAAYLRPDDAERDAAALSSALAGVQVPITRVLILAESEGFSALRGACPPATVHAAREALSSLAPDVPAIVTGTNQYFADVNRDRPDYEGADGIVFAVNPQVHACDERSMAQNAWGIIDVVAFAQHLYPGLHVVLSPLDLLGRNGPYPAGPETADGRPANEDPRQRTTFAAAWTVAALAAMARSHTTSATLFELCGPRGVMTPDGSPYPLGRVLEVVAQHADRPLLPTRTSDEQRLAVLAFGTSDGPLWILGSMAPESLTARLPDGRHVYLAAYSATVVATDAITVIEE